MSVDTGCIKKLLDNPDTFLGVSKADAVGLFRTFIKQLYDLRMSSSTGESASLLLPELYIDNFDNEQIFQQLEMFNNHAVKEHRRAIRAVRARCHGKAAKIKNDSRQMSKHTKDDSRSVKKQVTLKSDNMSDLVADADDSTEEEVEADNDVDSEEESALQKLLDSMTDKKTPVENDDSDNDDVDDDDNEDSEAMLNSDSSDDNSDIDNNRTASASQHGMVLKQKNRQVSAVDDRFFKLAEMEAFLDEQDLKEQRHHSSDAHDTEDDDYDDYDLSADDKVETAYMYSDFFDPPDDDAVDDKKDDDTGKTDEGIDYSSGDELGDVSNDKVKDDETSDDDSAAASDGDGDDDDNDEQPPLKKTKHKLLADEDNVADSRQGVASGQQLSSFEKRQEKLRHKISELEESNLREKSWQLSGEVLASARPENSLLAETLDFEYMTRQAPVITETTTKKLEDLIIQRIKDKAWDDVERKARPVDKMSAYRKKTVLDQEKSKLSLSQIYEQQFLKQTQKGGEEEEEEDPKHLEIKTVMQSLFVKLDALANFHFTPKPVIPDVKIVSNLPALSVEETIPSAVSDATLLAPQEVETKQKRELIGKSERTTTDKLRERRLKKRRQKARRLQKEKRDKLKAENSARLGSMKNLMDTVTTSSQKSKNNHKTRHSKEKKSKKTK